MRAILFALVLVNLAWGAMNVGGLWIMSRVLQEEQAKYLCEKPRPRE